MPTLAETWEERGLQKGLQQGLEKGRQEGHREAVAHDVLAILETRFGDVPEALAQHLQTFDDVNKLKALFKVAITTRSLDEFYEIAGY